MTRLPALAARLAFLLFVLSTQVLADPPAYYFDFERTAEGAPFTRADWLVYGPAGVGFVQGPGRAITDSEHARSGVQSIRVFYPASTVGPSEGGHQAALLLEPEREYCLSYWLRFGEDFSWGGSEQGGKLPGLGQGKLCSGGATCDGSNGFSARYMWREGGLAVLYLYHMDKPHKWGEDFTLLDSAGESFRFPRGEWIHLAQRVRINDGDTADGEVQVWVNGNEALKLDGLRFVSDGSSIDTFYFSTFHGGNTADWGPSNDSYLWIDDIAVTDNVALCGALK